MKKNAFTIIELVFVIVILGILSAIAVPKFATLGEDAHIANIRSVISSVRASIINERQSRLIKGDNSFINKLHSSDTMFFDNNGTSENELLTYGVKAENTDNHWQEKPTQTDSTAGKEVWEYIVKISGDDNKFVYTQKDGKFTCTQGSDAPFCDDLTK